MTLEQAKEFAEYLNQHLKPTIRDIIIDRFIPAPKNEEFQDSYFKDYWRFHYEDEDYFERLREEDLTIGYYFYYHKNTTPYFEVMTGKWLNENVIPGLYKKFSALILTL